MYIPIAESLPDSQYDEPLCEKGYIELDSGKRIGITRIHIEEVPESSSMRTGIPILTITAAVFR